MVHFILLFLSLVLALNKPNLSYRTKSGSLYDRRVSIGEIEADFDTDLYLIRGIECDRYFQPNRSMDFLSCEESCNYAVKDACGKPDSRSRYTEKDCTCPNTHLCNEDLYKWEYLAVNDSTIQVQSGSSAMRFRVFLPEWAGYRFKFFNEMGENDFDVRWTPLGPNVIPYTFFYGFNTNPWWTAFSKGTVEEELWICPDHPGYKLGTLELLSFCFTVDYCNFNLTFSQFIIPAPLVPPPSRCSGKVLPPNYKCMEADQSISDHLNGPTDYEPRNYVFFPDQNKCPNAFYISNARTQHDYFYFAMSITTPNFTHPRYGNSEDVFWWNPSGGQLHMGFAWDCGNVPQAIYMKVSYSIGYYISILNGASIGWRLQVTDSRDMMYLQPISELTAIGVSDLTAGWMKLRCSISSISNVDFKSEIRMCRERRFLGETQISNELCSYAFGSFATTPSSSNILHPPPYCFNNYLIMSYMRGYRLTWTDRVNDSISASIVLSSVSTLGLTQYYDEDLLNNCTATFYGILTDANMDSYHGVDIIPKAKGVCSYDSFVQARERLTTMHEELSHAESQDAAAELSYIADSSWFHNSIQDCNDLFRTNLLVIQAKNVTKESASCVETDPVKMAEDPCCNITLTWSSCCFKKSVSVVQNQSAYFRNATFNNNCSNPACTEIYAQQLAIDVLDVCPDPDELRAPWVLRQSSFWTKCATEVFGNQDLRYAPFCTSDSNCSTGTCNPFTHQCVGNIKFYERHFLQCLVREAPLYVKFFLYPNIMNKERANETYLVDAMLNDNSEVMCQNKVNLDFVHSTHWIKALLCPELASCGNQYDAVTILYRWMDDQESQCYCLGLCGFTERLFTEVKVTPATCSTYDPVRTVSSQVQNKTSLTLGQSYCMVCGNGLYNCEYVTTAIQDKATCENTKFCVYPNGTVLSGNCDMTQGQCLLPKRNSNEMEPKTCNGVSCTPETCSSVIRCKLTEYFNDTMGPYGYPLYNRSANGICLVNTNPYPDTDDKCLVWNYAQQWVPTKSGCVAYDVQTEEHCLTNTLGDKSLAFFCPTC
eukprot:TRINITY_DN2897_c0_g1_i6.p1 TRINITY_DN2897_c0_g1~~TRINITY_DN2897_c0_g1_i6.p1  ORF type:complete len:1049 (+),score=133.11 TRINITY_DN2897_c0_g1_i6:143-3289(+)